jgi:hypothetical protein
MSGGFWAVFWLAVVLKLPIAALLYLVWWAIKDPPQAEAGEEDGGSRVDDPHPRLRPPQPPRRGPHAEPAPAPPARVRAASSRRQVPGR